jgi:hypothetical protein
MYAPGGGGKVQIGSAVKLTIPFYLVPRSRTMGLYLHSHTRLHFCLNPLLFASCTDTVKLLEA